VKQPACPAHQKSIEQLPQALAVVIRIGYDANLDGWSGKHACSGVKVHNLKEHITLLYLSTFFEFQDYRLVTNLRTATDWHKIHRAADQRRSKPRHGFDRLHHHTQLAANR
jgi:hypothetical protein